MAADLRMLGPCMGPPRPSGPGAGAHPGRRPEAVRPVRSIRAAAEGGPTPIRTRSPPVESRPEPPDRRGGPVTWCGCRSRKVLHPAPDADRKGGAVRGLPMIALTRMSGRPGRPPTRRRTRRSRCEQNPGPWRACCPPGLTVAALPRSIWVSVPAENWRRWERRSYGSGCRVGSTGVRRARLSASSESLEPRRPGPWPAAFSTHG